MIVAPRKEALLHLVEQVKKMSCSASTLTSSSFITVIDGTDSFSSDAITLRDASTAIVACTLRRCRFLVSRGAIRLGSLRQLLMNCDGISSEDEFDDAAAIVANCPVTCQLVMSSRFLSQDVHELACCLLRNDPAFLDYSVSRVRVTVQDLS